MILGHFKYHFKKSWYEFHSFVLCCDNDDDYGGDDDDDDDDHLKWNAKIRGEDYELYIFR